MGTSYLGDTGVYLIDTIFGLYIGAVVLRFLFQAMDVDYHNPITQFLVKITAPLVKPLNQLLPNVGNVNLAVLFLAIGLTFLKFFLRLQLSGQNGAVEGLLLLSIADVLGIVLTIMFWALIIRVILSWVNPDPYQPAVSALIQFTEPFMAPARRIVPAIGGLDLSPIALFILIQLTFRLVHTPLLDMAYRLL